MGRAQGEVCGDMIRVHGREFARVMPAVAVDDMEVVGGLPLVVRAKVRDADRPSWMASVVAEFEAASERLSNQARTNCVEIWWRPTREDVLSDVPSTLSFFRKHAGYGLVLDPGAMMTSEMMSRVEEHVERVVEAMGGHEALRLVVVRGGKVGEVVERRMEGLVGEGVPMVRVGELVGVGLQ